jgi:hypothetical protein
VTATHDIPELTTLDRAPRALQSPLVDDDNDSPGDVDAPPRFLTEAGTV